jgi:hypothetical protein
MVQQVAPTNAIRLAKLGINITIVPVIKTITIRRQFWKYTNDESLVLFHFNDLTFAVAELCVFVL